MASPCTIEALKATKIQESNKRPIYCVDWAEDKRLLRDDRGDKRVPFFASVGGRGIKLYSQNDHACADGGAQEQTIELFQSYKDCDSKEDFYTCVFAGRSAVNGVMPDKQQSNNDPGEDPILDRNLVYETPSTREMDSFRYWCLAGITGNGAQLLCVAGRLGVIKVLDPIQCKFIGFLTGHGDEIYDLKVSPLDETTLASASKDRSFRLWNLKTGACVAIFKGYLEAHRDAVVSLAWHPKAEWIASSSLDTTVKLWKTNAGTPVYQAIRQSHKDALAWKEERLKRTIDPIVVSTPQFSSDKLHMHGVDCVQFIGDLILSRSIENRIILWKPLWVTKKRKKDVDPISSQVEILWAFYQSQAEYWFIRFATNLNHRILACGNALGDIALWDMASKKRDPILLLRGSQMSRKHAVRWIVFSPNNKYMVASSDDGSLWIWEISYKTKS